MNTRAANAYRRGDLESAPKHVVLERLFDRFARDLVQAREAIVAKNIQKKANLLDHALRIVGELSAALDHNAAPELCANLAALYTYVMDRIGEANTKLTVGPLDDAAKLMAEVGDAFKAVHPR
jgi:flagellar secretion chaperone FliS